MRALSFLLAAQLFFTLLDATGKHLANDIGIPLIALARHLGQAALMLAILGPSLGFALVRTAHWQLQCWRGIVLGAFTLFFFTALLRLPQAEATAIVFIAPFAVMLLAGPLLGERVSWVRWCGAGTGFLGMLVIVRPGTALDPIGLLFALLTVACSVAFQVLTRRLATIESSFTTIFLSALIGVVVSAAVLPLQGSWGGWPDALDGRDIVLLLSLGLTGAVGQWCFIRAYFWSSASFVAPLVFLQLLWAGASGYVFFGDLPDTVSLFGMLLIVAGGAGSMIGEMRRKRATEDALAP